MRFYRFVIALALLWPVRVTAQKWFEVQSRFKSFELSAPDSGKDMSISPEVHFYSRSKGRVAIFRAVTLSRRSHGVGRGWGELLAGFSIRPRDYLQFEFGGGVEADKEIWRTRGMLWTGNLHTQFFAIFESGGSGSWYTTVWNWDVKYLRDEYNNNVETWTGLGLMAEYQMGYGPRVQVMSDRGEVWFAYLLPTNGRTRRGGLSVGYRWNL